MKSTAGYGVYVKMLSDYMEREVNRSLCSLELTFSQHKVLMLLTHRPDHTSALKAVESEFHAAQSTVAGLAARLEKRDWLFPFRTRAITGSSTSVSPPRVWRCAKKQGSASSRLMNAWWRRSPPRSVHSCCACSSGCASPYGRIRFPQPPFHHRKEEINAENTLETGEAV